MLGKKIKGGGIKDGEQVLDLLVKNQHTARHISLQLAEHFVSDDPPPALVARMAKTFEKSKGDIRAVMTTMIYSPEFWSRAAFRAKVKTPFELVASTTRALGADVDQPLQLAQWVSRIGEPLYQCLPPNGYSDKAATWVSTGALLNRVNFAVALTSNKVRGAQVDINSLVGADVGANPQSGARSGRNGVPRRTSLRLHPRDAGKGNDRAAYPGREARRSRDAGQRRPDYRPGSRLTGISEAIV